MDLIYYRGLNCHLASIINIANALGVNYLDAYATLWSETDFTDASKYNIYVSKRVFMHLKAIGVTTETLDRDKIKREETLSKIPNGEWFLVGMDTFYIPWHPVFRHFNDFHYFFAVKNTVHSFLCFDPVYNEKYKTIKSSDLISDAFELSHIYKIEASTSKNKLTQEAKEVLRCHPKTKEKLLAKILQCRYEGKSAISLLIKQVNAMINNRYLFRHFFLHFVSDSMRYEHFFDDFYFLKWEAVRNGLYKASIMKDNKNLIDEIYGLFDDLITEEIAMAKEIVLEPVDIKTQSQ